LSLLWGGDSHFDRSALAPFPRSYFKESKKRKQRRKERKNLNK